MKRYLLFFAVFAAGATMGATVQQLRLEEQKIFWQNSLKRYNLMTTAYGNICLPMEALENSAEAVGLSSELISQSDDARTNLVFLQTGSIQPFTKDLGNMRFHLDEVNRCVTLQPGE